MPDPCGLYYKHIMIVNYDSSIVNKFRASLTDDARVVIYNCHMFIGHWSYYTATVSFLCHKKKIVMRKQIIFVAFSKLGGPSAY